jgi:hypothetical protein
MFCLKQVMCTTGGDDMPSEQGEAVKKGSEGSEGRSEGSEESEESEGSKSKREQKRHLEAFRYRDHHL